MATKATTTKNYRFTFRLSGLDCNKQSVKDTGTFYQTMQASTQALAEKKLRANYYKSVQVDIQSVQITEQVTVESEQFEKGQKVVYSYCPGIAFTGIIAGSKARLNGEDGYMLQTPLWTEFVPVRFLKRGTRQ